MQRIESKEPPHIIGRWFLGFDYRKLYFARHLSADRQGAGDSDTIDAEQEAEKAAQSAKRKKIAEFLKALKQQDGLIQTLVEGLWYATVQAVTVYGKERVAVTFKNGETVEVGI